MNAIDELRRMLDEFERDLCHAGCGVECGTYAERKELLDGVKDRYAQAIAATLGNTCETCPQMDNPDSFIRYLMKCERTCHNISDPPEGFLCSLCGWGDFAEPSHLLTTAKFTGNDSGPNHCPNCGARVEVTR